jgi:hypothetical protein
LAVVPILAVALACSEAPRRVVTAPSPAAGPEGVAADTPATSTTVPTELTSTTTTTVDDARTAATSTTTVATTAPARRGDPQDSATTTTTTTPAPTDTIVVDDSALGYDGESLEPGTYEEGSDTSGGFHYPASDGPQVSGCAFVRGPQRLWLSVSAVPGDEGEPVALSVLLRNTSGRVLEFPAGVHVVVHLDGPESYEVELAKPGVEALAADETLSLVGEARVSAAGDYWYSAVTWVTIPPQTDESSGSLPTTSDEQRYGDPPPDEP